MVCAAALRAPAALPERSVEEPVSFKFDRRRGRRLASTPPGSMRAVFADGEGRFGIAQVDLLDACPGGLGIRTTGEIEPGMTVSLHPQGSRFAAFTATVVHRTPCEDGYRLGLAIQRPQPHRAA